MVRNYSVLPVGRDICGFEPGITQDEVIGSNVGNVKAKGMGLGSGRDREVDVVTQVSSSIRGSVGVLDFVGGFHIPDSQPILVDKVLCHDYAVRSDDLFLFARYLFRVRY